jgi:hypothetical protein
MSKNPEFARQASEIVRHQDAIRSANEELIKLSQRFGRMIPRLSRLDPSVILSWLSLYSKIKDRSKRTDEEMDGLSLDELASSNPVLQLQVGCYQLQRQRLGSKVEVMDDILAGMMEDLLENGSFEEAQKQEMRAALDSTMEKSLSGSERILAQV